MTGRAEAKNMYKVGAKMLLKKHESKFVAKYMTLYIGKKKKRASMQCVTQERQELPSPRTDCTNPILFIEFSSFLDIFTYSLKWCYHVSHS